jgi:hypothetical protein
MEMYQEARLHLGRPNGSASPFASWPRERREDGRSCTPPLWPFIAARATAVRNLADLAAARVFRRKRRRERGSG